MVSQGSKNSENPDRMPLYPKSKPSGSLNPLSQWENWSAPFGI